MFMCSTGGLLRGCLPHCRACQDLVAQHTWQLPVLLQEQTGVQCSNAAAENSALLCD